MKRQFACTDKDLNIILQHTTEYLTEEELKKEDAGRKVGIVMVKKEHIKSLQVKQTVS